MTINDLWDTDFAAGTSEAWTNAWKRLDCQLAGNPTEEQSAGMALHPRSNTTEEEKRPQQPLVRHPRSNPIQEERRRGELRRLVLDARLIKAYRWMDKALENTERFDRYAIPAVRHHFCMTLLQAALWSPSRSATEIRNDRRELAKELNSIAARLKAVEREGRGTGLRYMEIEKIADDLSASCLSPKSQGFKPLGLIDPINPTSSDPHAGGQPKAKRAHSTRTKRAVVDLLHMYAGMQQVDYEVAATLVDLCLNVSAAAKSQRTRANDLKELTRKNSARLG